MSAYYFSHHPWWATLIAVSFWSSATLADMDLPDLPLFLTSVGVKPNLVMTIDDSASMMSAYLPESLYGCRGSSFACDDNVNWADTKRFKSSYFNPMYYSPFVNYAIPSRPDQPGVYTTSFRAAKKNGFDSNSATRDFGANQYGAQIHYTNGTGTDTTTESQNKAPYYYLFYTEAGYASPPDSDCTGTLSQRKNDDDCYIYKQVTSSSGPGGTDERQNFANWYSFYRTRALATMSAAMRSMAQVDLESLRFSWQTLNCTSNYTNCCNTLSASSSYKCTARDRTNRDNRIDIFDSSHRTTFFDWLENSAPPSNAGTPLQSALKRAGDYYSTSGVHSPYAQYPHDNVGTEHSCRRNFHLMMTDGVWNSRITGVGNQDGTSITSMPDDDFSYSPKSPYRDGQSNTLADFAFHYWATDLRDGGSADNASSCTGATCNKVPSNIVDQSGNDNAKYWNPRNDPASWQHMTNFMVSLGLGASLANPAWGGSTYEGDYEALASGSKSWPTIDLDSDNDPIKVYDLWHAALNSRGLFLSADDPDSLSEAFSEAIDSISTIAASGGGAGLGSNSTNIDQAGTVIFEAKFNADWSGQLLARPVEADYELGVEYWDAGQLIPAPYARNIFTIDDSGSAAAFTPANCSGELETELDKNSAGGVDTGLACEQRVNWLLGDGEVENAQCDDSSSPATLTITATAHGFVAGDKVTITEIETGGASSAKYNGSFEIDSVTTDTFDVTASAGCDASGYTDGGRVRYTQFRNRANSILGDIMNSDPVYVSNDDYGYGDSASTVAGQSSYDTYVSSKISATKPPVIYAGANDGMLHGFQADVEETNSGVELLGYVPRGVYSNLSKLPDPGYMHRFYVDGPLSSGDAYLGSSWGTYLVGGLGAGGTSIFALDISDPTNFDAGDVLWEKTANDSDTAQLGLTFSRPQIAPTSTSQWSVITGNGYNSSSGLAYLYVLDLFSGSRIAAVAAGSDTDNGLSTPHLYSSGGKIIDVVYAGDLQGNLWKFEKTASGWGVANGGYALFSTPTGQAITAEPKVASHPQGGVLVYFGTGRYLTTDDLTDDTQQAFYAIWDKPAATGTVPISDLAQYQIEWTQTFSGYSARVTSAASVDWSTQRGWYLGLDHTANEPAERVVSTPLVMEFNSPSVPDRVLFVTNTPASDPCERGGTTWLMELDLITGGRTASSVFDFNADDEFDTEDMIDTDNDNTGDTTVSGIALPESYGLTGEPLLLETDDGFIIKEFSGSTGKSGPGGGPKQQGEPPSGTAQRIYWKQIH